MLCHGACGHSQICAERWRFWPGTSCESCNAWATAEMKLNRGLYHCLVQLLHGPHGTCAQWHNHILLTRHCCLFSEIAPVFRPSLFSSMPVNLSVTQSDYRQSNRQGKIHTAIVAARQPLQACNRGAWNTILILAYRDVSHSRKSPTSRSEDDRRKTRRNPRAHSQQHGN